MSHNSQTKKNKHTNQAKEIERLEAKVRRLEQDLSDISSFAVDTPLRCKKCKRLYPSGYICPCHQE